MALSEIRVNTTKTRTGVGTITYTETGPVITGIATASNFKTGSTNVHSTGVELSNINTGGSTATFGGAISGTTASFSGNVSIGGTLTYEDVTNIDSVGIITAKNAIIIAEDNAIHFRGATDSDKDAILRQSAGGGQLLINSRHIAKLNIDSNGDSTDAYFAIGHGAATGSSTELFRVQENGEITHTAASGNTVITLKRSNTNTTGLVGGINFAALDGHSVGSIQARGDGNDEGAHLQFYTTSAAAGDIFNGANIERLRIDSGGRLFTGASTQLLDSTAGTIHIDGGTSGGRIALRGTTTSAGGGLGEIFAFWNNNKVAGIIALAGHDTSNKDNGHLTFYTRPDLATGVQERVRIDSSGNLIVNKNNARSHAVIILSKADAGYAKLEFDVGTSQKAYIELDASEDLVHYGAAGVDQLFYAGGGKRLTITNDKVMFSVDAKVETNNSVDLGASGAKWKDLHLHGVAHLGANGSWVKENNVRFQSAGTAYIDHATVGQNINFRTSNSSSLDTTAMFVRSDGRVQVYCLNNARGLELNVGSNAGSLVFDRNGVITSNIRAGDAGSNVAGGSGGGSRVKLNKEYIQWYTFPYTTNIGDAPTYTERMRLWNGGLAVGYRVGTSSVYSNQPVAFQSARVNPDGADANVHTAQRCNLYVGSNSGWASGDGGVIGLGGSGTGSAGQERLWGYIKASRQSSNGWEYPGYLDFGTQGWTGNTTVKRQRIWGDGQVEWFPTDNTMMSWKVGGAQRMKFTHTGGGNVSITNSNGTMTYGSTSDYRLKKNESAITNALTTVKALKPYQFTWKSDDKLGQGFFAHEAQAVLPDIGVVTGTKDAVYTEDDRNESYKKDDPDYQAVDYSKLVPLLTAALQELEARVASLESS